MGLDRGRSRIISHNFNATPTSTLLVAIVKKSLEASGPNQDSLPDLAKKYESAYFQDAKDMFADDTIGPDLDGVMLATPHTTHYGIGQVLLDEAKRRIDDGEKPLHILMEKPVTANVEEAKKLHEVSHSRIACLLSFWSRPTGTSHQLTSVFLLHSLYKITKRKEERVAS